MGLFIDAQTVKMKSRLSEIQNMDVEDIELLLIRTAEARLEESFRLELDTDADPRSWAAHFDRYPNKRTDFQEDMKAALVLLIDRMQGNPHGYGSQSVRGSSVTFGKAMPLEVQSLLRKWGEGGAKTGRVFRT